MHSTSSVHRHVGDTTSPDCASSLDGFGAPVADELGGSVVFSFSSSSSSSSFPMITTGRKPSVNGGRIFLASILDSSEIMPARDSMIAEWSWLWDSSSMRIALPLEVKSERADLGRKPS